jgi:hypothetical protein
MVLQGINSFHWIHSGDSCYDTDEFCTTSDNFTSCSIPSISILKFQRIITEQFSINKMSRDNNYKMPEKRR